MSRLPIFSLKEFTGRFDLFVPPVEAGSLIDWQCNEIDRFQKFIQEHFGTTRVVKNKQTVLALAEPYRAEAVKKDLQISESQFRQMTKKGLIESKSYSIIGFGQRFVLFFPSTSLRIQCLIRAYQSPARQRDRREIWVQLVRLAQSKSEEFCQVVLNSKEPSVRAFQTSEAGKILINHLKLI